MLTFIFMVLIVIGAVIGVGVAAALLAVCPVLLVALAFIALDVVVIKWICRKIRKKK